MDHEADQRSSGFALRAGISFCRVADRTLFLDLPADRYFCLSPAGDRAFTRLVEGIALTPCEIAVLDNLAVEGPIIRCIEPGPIAPCSRPPLPITDLLDRTDSGGCCAAEFVCFQRNKIGSSAAASRCLRQP